jgi:uncharacterized cupredoxin-like copper-binding protein
MNPARVARRLIVAGAALAAFTTFVAAVAFGAGDEPVTLEIRVRYSHYVPSLLTVPAGRPVTFVIVNEDPIDHEWIVGDAQVHLAHRTGTEAHHGERPTEVSIAAGGRVTTTVTFPVRGSQLFICHLPGHEAFGMVGTLEIR